MSLQAKEDYLELSNPFHAHLTAKQPDPIFNPLRELE
jgi:hypothetical protein